MKQHSVAHFSIIEGRSSQKAKAMAIAKRMIALSMEGGGQRTDEDVINKFPPDLWEQAQTLAARPEMPCGVLFTNNRYQANKRIKGKIRYLGCFSIKDRGDLQAKSLATASRMMYDFDDNQERKDQATIESFSPDVWEEAGLLASRLKLPSGVHEKSPPKPGYVVTNERKQVKFFAIFEGRDKSKAKRMAIATLLTLQKQSASS